MPGRNALIAEFIGTFCLCFAGISAILSDTLFNGAVTLVGVALAHGLALSIAVSVFGGISGAHFNPAVSIAMLSTGRLSPAATVQYIAAQLLGAVAAALACKGIFAAEIVDKAFLGIPLPGKDVKTGDVLFTTSAVLFAEIILTFLLVTAIFGTAIDERGKAVKIGGFGIGLTVSFDILAMGKITGASMNPARSFGPALAMGFWEWHWVYWLAPVIGAVLAAQLYHHVLLAPDETTAPSRGTQAKREHAKAGSRS
jgi:MIP family channel proteins